jgi:ribosomal protein S27AE
MSKLILICPNCDSDMMSFRDVFICGNCGKTLPPPGIPCKHVGCLHHITHPCEGCGRVGGFTSISKSEAKTGTQAADLHMAMTKDNNVCYGGLLHSEMSFVDEDEETPSISPNELAVEPTTLITKHYVVITKKCDTCGYTEVEHKEFVRKD